MWQFYSANDINDQSTASPISIQALLLSVHKYMATWDPYKHNYKTYNRNINKSATYAIQNTYELRVSANSKHDIKRGKEMEAKPKATTAY